MLSIHLLNRKRKLGQLGTLKQSILQLNTLPKSLRDCRGADFKQFKDFVSSTTGYQLKIDANAGLLVADLLPGLKHHDIHCISFTESIGSIIHYDLDEFSNSGVVRTDYSCDEAAIAEVWSRFFENHGGTMAERRVGRLARVSSA